MEHFRKALIYFPFWFHRYMRDVVSLMVYFWLSITENQENHSRGILVQAIDSTANWINQNRIRPRSCEIRKLWSKKVPTWVEMVWNCWEIFSLTGVPLFPHPPIPLLRWLWKWISEEFTVTFGDEATCRLCWMTPGAWTLEHTLTNWIIPEKSI